MGERVSLSGHTKGRPCPQIWPNFGLEFFVFRKIKQKLSTLCPTSVLAFGAVPPLWTSCRHCGRHCRSNLFSHPSFPHTHACDSGVATAGGRLDSLHFTTLVTARVACCVGVNRALPSAVISRSSGVRRWARKLTKLTAGFCGDASKREEEREEGGFHKPTHSPRATSLCGRERRCRRQQCSLAVRIVKRSQHPQSAPPSFFMHIFAQHHSHASDCARRIFPSPRLPVDKDHSTYVE